nr:DUF2806 domain-containing protein [uncultured Allomuricauda sp.]
MPDPVSLGKAIDSATKVANTPLFTTVIDKVTGFRLSEWAAEGEVRKRKILDEYEKLKGEGLAGMQYIENIRKAENLINTAVKTSKHIDPEKPNEIEIDNDFFWNTLEYTKTVSNEDMQELIAKILASEYNEPGTYSVNTLHTLKSLGKGELEIFQACCSLLVQGQLIPDLIFSNEHRKNLFFKELNISFNIFLNLKSVGLFLPNVIERGWYELKGDNVKLEYFDKSLNYRSINPLNTDFLFPTSHCLSASGIQIAKHLSPSFNKAYFNWLQDYFQIPNYLIVKVH